MGVGERIKNRRKQLGMSAEQVAAELGISPATIYRYESKDIMNMRIDKLEPLATVLHTTPGYLMGWDDDATDYDDGDVIAEIPLSYIEACDGDVRRARKMMLAADEDAARESLCTFPPAVGVSDVSFLGDVAAGFDRLANAEYGCLRVPDEWLGGRPASDFFALRVKGSSMYPMYCEGDEILCLSTPDMGASGRVGVIVYNGGEATLKKIVYKRGEDWLDLVPINPEYAPKRIEGADLEQCRVLGRVLRVIRTVDEM